MPDEAKGQSAVVYFESIAPEADEVAVSRSERLEFIHCGANFGKILCPSCGTLIDLKAWQEWMDQDFQGKAKGFVLSRRALPCCAASVSLHDLKYEWPQGFARFSISAQNPNIGRLSQEHRRRFEQLLGTSVRVIYEHF